MNNQATPIPVLVAALRHAKAEESAANQRRLDLEAQIVARFVVPEGGEGTVKDEEFQIAFKLTRKVDTEALQASWAKLDKNSQKAFRWSADVDLKQLRALSDLDPDSAFVAQGFITTKPAKPSITLKDLT